MHKPGTNAEMGRILRVARMAMQSQKEREEEARVAEGWTKHIEDQISNIIVGVHYQDLLQKELTKLEDTQLDMRKYLSMVLITTVQTLEQTFSQMYELSKNLLNPAGSGSGSRSWSDPSRLEAAEGAEGGGGPAAGGAAGTNGGGGAAEKRSFSKPDDLNDGASDSDADDRFVL